MIGKIYTIGFTKKTAESFFNVLKENRVELVLDIRLNNTSQLSAFAKFSDIRYFLKVIGGIEYIHDTKFSPKETTLKRYKKKEISWNQYVTEFNNTMQEREIINYIKGNYGIVKNMCLLCSESTPNNCHRTLVATKFLEASNKLEIIHL